MNFSCEKNVLLDALNIVSKAVPSRPVTQILEGFYLKCDNSLIITGNDLDIGIEAVVDVDIAERGSVVLNAKTFLDIIRRLPDATLTVQVDDKNQATIKCKNIEYSIMGIEGDEFPAIPAVDGLGKFVISAASLKSAIRQTIFAVAQNNTRQVLMGSLFEITGNRLKVVAVDGFRMAIRNEVLSTNYEDMSFIIPGKTLNELTKILKDEETPVDITLTEKYVMFTCENIKIVSRLIEGEFLNYNKIIPSEKSISATVRLEDILASVDRCEPIIAEDSSKNPIRLLIDNDTMIIKCITNTGRVYDDFQISDTQKSLEIGFNHRYLRDALKACECEFVVMELNTPLSPCIIRPVEGDEFLHMVLPVRLKE